MTSSALAAELSREDGLLYAFRRNVVVAASAGTGKTHRLTSLWVLSVLGLTSMGQKDERTPAPPVAPDRIVATTFSRAAAQEMARRVERALDVLATPPWPDDDPVVAVVRARQATLGGAAPDFELAERARLASRGLASARIDTLHGLAAGIVRVHAERLRVAPDVRVLDDDEAQDLADAALDRALSIALAAGGKAELAARAMIQACGGVPQTRAAVVRLLDRLDDEGLSPREMDLADAAAEGRALLDELTRVARSCAAAAGPAIREPAARLAIELGHGPPGMLPADAVPHAMALLSARVPSMSKQTEGEAALAELVDRFGRETKAERARRICTLLSAAPELHAREVAALDLLERLRSELYEARAKAGAVSFGDLLRLARDALAGDSALRADVRAGVEVLLVDEFQDTSLVQRDLVYLLRARDSAGPGVPRPRELYDHGLFLVGDRKQSIYGFRGADVSVFARTCVELAGGAAADALGLDAGDADLQPQADFVALRESRRSGNALLSFVNAFCERDFALGAGDGDFEVRYGDAERLESALVPRPDRRDEVVLVRDDGKVPEGADPLVSTATGPLREALAAAAFVATEIPASNGRLAWRDVAILARRRSTIPLVELALARVDVPYVVAGRALYDALEVRDVSSLLRFLIDPRDRLALASLLRGPMVGLSDAALAALSVPGRGLALPWVRRSRGREERAAPAAAGDGVVALAPEDRARLADFRARHAGIRRAALRLPPADAVRVAVEAFDLDRILCGLPRAQARLGNVDRLVEIARRRGGTLASFARWLDERIEDESDEAEAAVFSPDEDAARLLTIHASKGLDFPVVVLVDLDAAPRGDTLLLGHRRIHGSAERRVGLAMRHFGTVPRAPADDRPPETAPIVTLGLREARLEARARDLAERKRLTYVAMTRARQMLALVVPATRPRMGSAHATLAMALREPELCAMVGRDESATALLAGAERRRSGPTSRPSSPDLAVSATAPCLPLQSPSARVPIATTPLSVFASCPRRFRLRFLVGLDEPVSSGQLDLFDLPHAGPDDERPDEDALDPRALGRAAHRVLERWPADAWGQPTSTADVAALLAREGLGATDAETLRIAEGIARFLGGAWASSVRTDGAVVERESPFVVSVGDGPRRVSLRGAIDLLVHRPDGTIDVIDYKRSRPRADLAPYAFQLQAYALAARRREGAARIRAGILFLGATDEPVMLPDSSPDDLAAFERDVAALGARLADARWQDRWDPVPLETCQRLRCGFVPACHGPAR